MSTGYDGARVRAGEPPVHTDEGPVIDGEFERIDERAIDPRKTTQGKPGQTQRSQTNGAKAPGDRPNDRPSDRPWDRI